MDLLPKLRRVADVWVAAHRRTDDSISLKTLGVRSVANSKLFERKGMSVETFSTVAIWLGQPENWPAAMVPLEACQTLCQLGVLVPAGHWMPEAA
jgi:hypothetical protein